MGKDARVVVIGAGGNIGSHLIPHLARTDGIVELVLVDRDRYEPRNRANQAFPGRAVGRAKAAVQAAVARRLDPTLRVTAVAEDVEGLPLGRLRADLVVTAVDNRRARQAVNRMTRRLGVPWLDAGVLETGWLARVTRFDPGDECPCLECGWSEADYRELEQRYPCPGGAPAPAPSAASSALGALAAGLLALEVRKELAGAPGRLAPGTEVVLEAAHHRQYVTRLTRNRACRLAGHAPWRIERPRRPLRTVGELLARGGGNGARRVAVEGKRFLLAARCGECGATRRTVRLWVPGAGTSAARCRSCGAGIHPAGWDLREHLEGAELRPAELARPLAAIGIRPGEVVTVGGPGAPRHLEMGRM